MHKLCHARLSCKVVNLSILNEIEWFLLGVESLIEKDLSKKNLQLSRGEICVAYLKALLRMVMVSLGS